MTSEPHPSRIHKKTKVVKRMAYRYDMTEMDFGTFARFAYMGIPQALEAMYAPEDSTMIDHLTAYRSAFRPSLPLMRDNYRRVIRNHNTMEHTAKQRFHALRLAYNFREAQEGDGTFSPRLEKEIIQWFTYLSQPENFREFNDILSIINLT